jgi:pectate lyase
VHLCNNYTRGQGVLYAVCASVEAQIVSQCNVYEAGSGPRRCSKYMPEKAANRDDVVAGHIRSDSEGDAFLNGALPCLIDGAELQNCIASAQRGCAALRQMAGCAEAPRH